VATSDGTALRLAEASIPSGGIPACRSKLRPHERVVGALLAGDAEAPLLVSSDGYVCRREMGAFPADRARRRALPLGPEARLAAVVCDAEQDGLILGSADGRITCVVSPSIPVSQRAGRGKQVVEGGWVGPVTMAAGIAGGR